MGEYSSIDNFREGVLKEYRANGGRRPAVAVMGVRAHTNLLGELKLFFGMRLRIPKPTAKILSSTASKFEFEGIHIFKSYTLPPDQMVFASIPTDEI
jgi:hypothetical protein